MQRLQKVFTLLASILLLLVSLLLAGIVGAQEKDKDERIQEFDSFDSTYHPENMGDGAGQGGSSSIKGQHGDRSITGSGSRRNTLRMHKDPGPGL